MAGYSQSAVKVTNRPWLYVAELLHRFENEYTKAISFASMIATRSPNPEARAALRQVIEHLHAAAKAHRILKPPVPGEFVDFGADLAQLCRALVSTGLDQHGIALHLAVSGSVRLDAVRSWCANLILSELITNASRHAFGATGGRIAVSVAVVSGRIVCRVRDDGSSSPTPKPGLGTQLIDALTADLDGNIERNYAASGTEVTLSFPMNSESDHFDF